MLNLPFTFRDSHSTFLAFKRQNYVYSYRVQLSMLKFGPTKTLLKSYVNHSVKKAQKELSGLSSLSIESIIANPFLSKFHFTFLYALCRFLQPHTVVETGVGLGTSSNFILQALKDNGFGELYSIDCPKSTYSSDEGIKINEAAYTSEESLPGCLVPEFLRQDWNLLLGKSRDILPPLCEHLGEIDLFFHDSEHTYQNMAEEYETVWPYIRKNGILASHDVDWNNAFSDFVNKKACAFTISKNGYGLVIN